MTVPSILEEMPEGPYVAAGAYVRNVPPHRSLPAECFLDVVHASAWVTRAAGSYRHHVGATSHPIRIDLAFDQHSLGLGTFTLSSAHTKELAGTVLWIGGAYCLLGQSTTETMSARLQLSEGRGLLVEGMIRFVDGRVHAFALELRREPNRGSLGNIVPMPMQHHRRT